MNLQKTIYIIITAFYLSNCSTPTIQQPKDYDLYQEIVEHIKENKDREAEKSLLNLLSAYPESSLVKPALFVIIDYHTQEKEYKIANFYLKRFKERFFNPSDKDYFLYLDIKLEYKQIVGEKINQYALINTIKKLEDFLQFYPDSIYKYNVATMHSHLYLTNVLNNQYIANLYTDMNKEQSANFYKQKYKDIDTKYIMAPKKNLIKKIFQ